MSILSDFRIYPGSINERFTEEVYTDTREVRRYYASSSQSDEILLKFDVMDDMREFYTAILDEAETDLALPYRIRNKRKELPVKLSSILDYCSNTSYSDEPPSKMIVQIADNDFISLQHLLQSPRKVLRRNQELVPLGNIQQIDSYCMRWLARQPGYTAVEKGGTKQKLMGVVRHESMDTLENRVLKQYMIYSLNEGRRYIAKYGREDRYRNSKKVALVRRFVSLVSKGLSMPEFNEVRMLHSVPVPNYTLQNNRFYHAIWLSYLRLANHITEIETMWRYRHRMFYETAKLIAIAAIDDRIHTDGAISHDIWMFQYASENGTFCSDPNQAYFDYCGETNRSFRIMDNDEGIEFRCRDGNILNTVMGDVKHVIRCYLIPDYAHLDVFPAERRGLSIIYSESGNEYRAETESMRFIGKSVSDDIAHDIYNAIVSSSFFRRLTL